MLAVLGISNNNSVAVLPRTPGATTAASAGNVTSSSVTTSSVNSSTSNCSTSGGRPDSSKILRLAKFD